MFACVRACTCVCACVGAHAYCAVKEYTPLPTVMAAGGFAADHTLPRDSATCCRLRCGLVGASVLGGTSRATLPTGTVRLKEHCPDAPSHALAQYGKTSSERVL